MSQGVTKHGLECARKWEEKARGTTDQYAGRNKRIRGREHGSRGNIEVQREGGGGELWIQSIAVMLA